ncbi:hypothetical protein V6Z11_A10G052200 [Gossypium hirsutum]
MKFIPRCFIYSLSGYNVGAPDQREFQLEKLQAKCVLKSMKKARPNVAGKKVRHLEQKSYYKF